MAAMGKVRLHSCSQRGPAKLGVVHLVHMDGLEPEGRQS